MKVENKDILITDPCYWIKDEDWGKLEEYDQDDFANLVGFELIAGKSGIGDIDGEVVEIDATSGETLRTIGKVACDAGIFAAAELDKVLAYNPDFNYETIQHCVTVVPRFTGELEGAYDDKGLLRFRGTGSQKASDDGYLANLLTFEMVL